MIGATSSLLPEHNYGNWITIRGEKWLNTGDLGRVERAAIPKFICIVDKIPTTAVGKIFKPQLIRWQIREVVTEEIQRHLPTELANKSVVEVSNHEKFGCFTSVTLPKSVQSTEIGKLTKTLDKYHFRDELNG